MSLFKRDRVLVSVERDSVSLALCSHRALDASHEHRIDLDVQRSFADALAVLREPLSQPPWRGIRREAIVSDRLVHYLALERPAGVRSPSELQLAIESRFAQTFAAAAPEWLIRLDLRPFAQHIVACAMPRDLVNGLQSVLSQSGHCASIRPHLLFSLSRHARHVPDDCWYAAVSRNCVSIARIRSASCRRIRVLPSQTVSSSSLSEMVEREGIMAGEEEDSVPVCVAGLAEETNTGNMLLFDQGRTFPGPYLATAAVAPHGV